MLSDPDTRRLYRLYIDQKRDSAQKQLAEGILEMAIRAAKAEFWTEHEKTREPILCERCQLDAYHGKESDQRHTFDDTDWREYVDRELRKI